MSRIRNKRLIRAPDSGTKHHAPSTHIQKLSNTHLPRTFSNRAIRTFPTGYACRFRFGEMKGEMMDWTPEIDARLKELHAKGISQGFIACWLRLPRSEVRTRLLEFGLLKTRARRPASRSTTPRNDRAAKPDGSARHAEHDEGDVVQLPGCPRGHLMSEGRIAALYRRAGSSYL